VKPTVILPVVAQPTDAERIQALEKTAYRLTLERDEARWERDRACALADVKTATATTQTARADAAEAALEDAVAESRRDKHRCRELAAEIGARDVQIDQLQRELAQAKHQLKQREKPRWPFSHTGNQL